VQPERRVTILGSFAYFAKTDLGKLVRRARERGVEVDFMADSGAFTAYTTGKTISLKGYATWLQVYGPYVNCAMTLDVIGDPAASGRNTLELEQMVGDATYIIPIFHVGSPWSELERWCATHPFVALGGGVAVNARGKAMMQWLIRAHKIARAHGAVLHGLGMTRPPYPDLLPFYSVDSSFWSQGSRNGSITLFDSGRGRWVCVRHPDDIKRGVRRPSASLVRAYGGDPVALANPGFARVGMRGKELGRAERDWTSSSALLSWMNYADHLAVHRYVPTPPGIHFNGPKIYLAVGSEGDFDLIVDLVVQRTRQEAAA